MLVQAACLKLSYSNNSRVLFVTVFAQLLMEQETRLTGLKAELTKASVRHSKQRT